MLRRDAFGTFFPVPGHRRAGALQVRTGERHWAAAALWASVATAVISAGYGAYSASEAQAQQNDYAKRNARLQSEAAQRQADAETAAGNARAREIAYDAAKRQ